jgi:Icc-related predicted phosphoesterase
MFAGSSAVTRAIKAFKPDIAICSHIHEADGIEDTLGSTRLICASKKGKIIEV